jgi:Ca2+-binding EF-hand superfamily protein
MSNPKSPTFKIVPSFKRSELYDAYETQKRDIGDGNMTESRSPNYRRPADSGHGYTGHLSDFDPEEKHVLERSYERPSPVKGYSGHIPISKFTRSNFNRDVNVESKVFSQTTPEIQTAYRTFGKGMDLQERYEEATQELFRRGQSQDMLMRIVQAKLSERVSSYAQQQIWLRNLYASFHRSGGDGLNELELRNCLEMLNIQFDDCQFLALFAYFDNDFSGSIDYEEFSTYAMVPNPKGGTAILTKSITSPMGSETWAPLHLKKADDEN